MKKLPVFVQNPLGINDLFTSIGQSLKKPIWGSYLEHSNVKDSKAAP
jgi:hypothetical protein